MRIRFKIYPANLFVTTQERQNAALAQIGMDLEERISDFTREDKLLEAQRIKERVTYDMEMIRELGHCSGIENYSRYFDGRKAGERPFCLLDYFPKGFPDYNRRKPRHGAANSRNVWRRYVA